MSTITIPRMTHAEWLAEAERRFGKNPLKWRFACPACAHTATCDDFKALGVAPDRAAVECIGRVHNELGTPGKRGKNADGIQPCNWAAFGLLGTLNGGVIIEVPATDEHDASTVNAFAFA